MCNCSEVKKSKQLMSTMFDVPTVEKKEKPPMWYYIVNGRETLMVSQDGEWIAHDLQHTIPLVFRSSARAKAWATGNVEFFTWKVKGSRFVSIGGVKVLNGV